MSETKSERFQTPLRTKVVYVMAEISDDGTGELTVEDYVGEMLVRRLHQMKASNIRLVFEDGKRHSIPLVETSQKLMIKNMCEQTFTYPIELDRLDSWQTCKNQDKSRKMKLIVQVHQTGEQVRYAVFFGTKETLLTLLKEVL